MAYIKKIKPKAKLGYKFCARCKTEKERGQFKPLRSAKDGLTSWCIPCVAAYQKTRHEATYIPRKPSINSNPAYIFLMKIMIGLRDGKIGKE